jgi:glutamate synthase domain-containing protein 3
MVSFDEMTDKDKEAVKTLLEKHFANTGSDIAEGILNDFDGSIKKFVKVIPNDYKKVVTVMEEELAKGTPKDDAMLIAFENVTGKKVEIA